MCALKTFIIRDKVSDMKSSDFKCGLVYEMCK